jgi:signal transduction histidine kinase
MTSPSSARPPDEPLVRREHAVEDLIRPVLIIVLIVVSALQLHNHRIIAPTLALVLFVLVSVISVGSFFSWNRLPEWQRITLTSAYALLAAVLLPLVHTTSVGATFAFVATGVAGARVASRRVSLTIATVAALVASGLTALVNEVAPGPGNWPWWIPLAVVLPVYIGTSRQDRSDALLSAQQAAVQAQRAAEFEAREAALEERGRIAREIHDVLGHSLSGIAVQLDLADALNANGRGEESMTAVRKARALAVDSIAETRRAVHALRENTLPLDESLRLMAVGDAVTFAVHGDPGPVPVEVAHAVIRTAQEALTNAAKYARGAARTMVVEFTPDAVFLTVSNRPGERPAAVASSSGVGLVGMRERAALLGGTLSAGPDPESGGWTVRLEVSR